MVLIISFDLVLSVSQLMFGVAVPLPYTANCQHHLMYDCPLHQARHY